MIECHIVPIVHRATRAVHRAFHYRPRLSHGHVAHHVIKRVVHFSIVCTVAGSIGGAILPSPAAPPTPQPYREPLWPVELGQLPGDLALIPDVLKGSQIDFVPVPLVQDQPVPEPSSILILMTALLGVAVARRVRR